MFEIILGCGIVVLLLITMIIIYHNKFQYVIIKIEEAENNINILLDKKQELLNRARPIIKKEFKLDEFLEELEKLENKGLNQFQMNSWLKDSYFDELEREITEKAVDTLVNHISELEEDNINWKGKYHLLSRKIDVTPNSVIRDKIKELEETKGDFATYIATSERIKVLNELLEGE